MNTKLSQMSAAALIFVLFTLLFGCSENSETPDAPAQPVLSDLNPSYEATLADGIDFRKPGYPAFLAEVSGMSGQESWGRWTDANNGPVAKFRFKQPLPQKFTLEISADALSPGQGKAILVRVGTVEKSFVVPKGSTGQATYDLVFESTNGADTLEIVPPKPASPASLNLSPDPRKLGVAMRSLKIRG